MLQDACQRSGQVFRIMWDSRRLIVKADTHSSAQILVKPPNRLDFP